MLKEISWRDGIITNSGGGEAVVASIKYVKIEGDVRPQAAVWDSVGGLVLCQNPPPWWGIVYTEYMFNTPEFVMNSKFTASCQTTYKHEGASVGSW